MLETSSWLLTDAAPFRAAPVSSGMKNEAVRLGREGQACLSLREVLQLKLQQRRTREELVKQGIMPPLKSSASFNEQRRSLERARTEDYLKRKIRCRPERSELVRRHILEESSAEPSLQAKQLLLKRARLADDLNNKISQRPGPMELVHKNILPVHCNMKQTITADADNSSLDEESSDAFSPEQMLSPLSQGHQHSPPETQTMDLTQAPPPLQTPLSSHTPSQKPANGTAGQKKPPALQKAGKVSTERTALRSKRIRDSKPKVKKLKYHQYVPPDQKTEHGPPPPPQLDSSYAKLLHQQQLFLQLQIINQQQNYNYHSILPAPPKPAADLKTPKIEPCPPTTSSNMNGHNQQTPSNVAAVNAGSLPSNLDELKVAELKQELKLRGLTVSGTKNGLIERLKNFQEQNSAITRVLTFKTKAASSPVIGGAYSTDSITPTSFRFSATSEKSGAKICSTSSSPPLSPAHSERSSTGMSPDEGSCHGDAFGEMVSSPLTQLSLQHSPPVVRIKQEPDSGESSSHCCMLEPQMDKDQMLREKDQRIRELTLMLLQKQQLVQSLRLQLQASPTGTSEDLLRVCVKEEDVDMLEERVAERQCMLGRAEVEQQQLVMKQNLKNVQQQTQQRTRTAPKTQFNSDKQLLQAHSSERSSPVCLLPMDLVNSNSSSTIVTDSNGNQFLLTSNQTMKASPRGGHPQGKATNQSRIQRFQSRSASFPNQRVCDAELLNNSQSKPIQTAILKQPIKKALKPDLNLTSNYKSSSRTHFLAPLDSESDADAVPASPNNNNENGCHHQADDLLDILIQHGDISENFKSTPDPVVERLRSPPPQASNHSSNSEVAESQVSTFKGHSRSGRLEDFLESTTGKPLLGVESGRATTLIVDLHNQMLSSPSILDHPRSPMDTCDISFSTHSASDLVDSAPETMDWLEFEVGGPGEEESGLTRMMQMNGDQSTSLFTTDFLDTSDLSWSNLLS